MLLSRDAMVDDESAAKPTPLPVRDRKLRRSSLVDVILIILSELRRPRNGKRRGHRGSRREAAEDSLRSSAKASAISAVELFPQLATTPSGISTSYPASIHAFVPPVTLSKCLKPSCLRMLVPALER